MERVSCQSIKYYTMQESSGSKVASNNLIFNSINVLKKLTIFSFMFLS